MSCMRGSGGSDPLLAALEELAALGSADDRAGLDALRGRLRDRRLRVLVAGEAKRGKSTLVNAMLSRPVLPAGVTPLTALATTVRYGSDENVRAVFADGHAENLPLSALGDLVTERGNPGNCRGVASVTVSVDAPILARGVELVEHPGHRVGLRAQHQCCGSRAGHHGRGRVCADFRPARIGE